MKRTVNQLFTAIMALESKPLTFDSEKLLRRLRAERNALLREGRSNSIEEVHKEKPLT